MKCHYEINICKKIFPLNLGTYHYHALFQMLFIGLIKLTLI